MLHLLLVWLCVSISLIIVSKLGLGIEVDSLSSALIAAVALGIVNTLIKPVLSLLAFPFTLLTLGLFALVVNGVCLAIASNLVSGFRVNGLPGAILGAIALSIVNLVVTRLLGVAR